MQNSEQINNAQGIITLRVLIDEGLSTLQQLGGIGYFSLSLWKHLRKFIDCDITNYSYLRRLPRAAKRAAYLALANLEPRREQYDVIHYQNYYVPRLPGMAKVVTTIHDFAGLTSPEVYPGWYNYYFRKVLRKAILRANAVTLSSYALKDELFGLFPDIEESKIHVCHHGVRSIFFESRPTEEDLRPMNLAPFSYFLFVGNLEKRKNMPFLLSQFIEARQRAIIAHDTKLVLVGKIGNGYEGFKDLISERNNILHLGRLSEEQVVALYRFCKAFIFPSLYEGFGVPILEAMTQRVPILISDIPSSLEFHKRHNGKCLVFERGRKESFAELLSHLDKNFADVSSNLDYGDLSIYSYDNVAREHLKVYQKVIEGVTS